MRRRVWHQMLRRWGRVRRGDQGWMVQGVSRKLAPGPRVQVFTRKEEANVSCWSKENGEWGLSIEVNGGDLTVYLHRRLQGSHWSTVIMRIRSKKSHSSWGGNPGASASCSFSEFLGKERRKVKWGLAGKVESQEGLVLMRRITACLCALILQRVTW